MARSVNKVILIGNVGKDPEIRAMPSGSVAANFSLATSESWKDKQTGEKQERTEWHRLVAFGKLAEVVEHWVHKGSLLYIEGSIRTNKWTDKSGQDKYSTEIIVDQMNMLSSPDQVDAAPPQRNTPPQRAAPARNQGDTSSRAAPAPRDRAPPADWDDAPPQWYK